MGRQKRAEGEPILIKKYANRRLYNTASSSYVTLEHLADLIKEGEDFVVVDAKSGNDLTHAVLTQIIFEREAKDDKPMLSLSFLRQLISLYGDKIETMVPGYLQSAMGALTKNQDKLRSAFSTGKSPASVLPVFEEITRQNMAMFQETLTMFTPNMKMGRDTASAAEAEKKDAEIMKLREELASLKDKVDALGD